jgi:fatty-acid desaturase
VDYSRCLKPNAVTTTVIQLSLPLAILLGIQSDSSWHWWAASLFFYAVVYTMIGNNIAYHRYFTHKHFTVSRPIEWLFLWAGSVSGIGDPISYATTHLVHHKHSDTELDPHGPNRGLRSVMFCFYKRVTPKDTPIVGRRVIELMKSYGWLHNYYTLFILANIAVFWAIDFRVFLFCWLIPASLFLWGLGMAVYTQHWGFKARNLCIDLWIPHYEGLHANHHDAPMAPNTAFRPGEIDYTYQFSRVFKPKFDWRGQPDVSKFK